MGDSPFTKRIRDRKNNVENPKHSQILSKQVSSPSLLPTAESEPLAVDPDAEVEATTETWPEAGPEWSIAFEE